MTLRGQQARVIDVTDDRTWACITERIEMVKALCRATPISLTHDDQFWAFGEPVRMWRVVEWL